MNTFKACGFFLTFFEKLPITSSNTLMAWKVAVKKEQTVKNMSTKIKKYFH